MGGESVVRSILWLLRSPNWEETFFHKRERASLVAHLVKNLPGFFNTGGVG